MRKILVLAFFVLGSVTCCLAAGKGFVSIFDGKTLAGWGGTDMSYWSVEDGTFTGLVTEEHPNLHTRWIIWQGGQVGDFEWKLKFRIMGTIHANSGLQYRSTFNEDGTHAVGYQGDMVRDPFYNGCTYDEGTGRTFLAKRGEKTIIDEDGTKHTTKFGDPDALFKIMKIDDWNDYRVVARGHVLKAFINGHLMSEVVDNDKKNFHPTGSIALQIHRGPAMKVQFKDILLKQYK